MIILHASISTNKFSRLIYIHFLKGLDNQYGQSKHFSLDNHFIVITHFLEENWLKGLRTVNLKSTLNSCFYI